MKDESQRSHRGGIMEGGSRKCNHASIAFVDRQDPRGTHMSLRVTQKASRRHAGDTQETPGRHPGRHPGGTPTAPEAQEPLRERNSNRS